MFSLPFFIHQPILLLLIKPSTRTDNKYMEYRNITIEITRFLYDIKNLEFNRNLLWRKKEHVFPEDTFIGSSVLFSCGFVERELHLLGLLVGVDIIKAINGLEKLRKNFYCETIKKYTPESVVILFEIEEYLIRRNIYIFGFKNLIFSHADTNLVFTIKRLCRSKEKNRFFIQTIKYRRESLRLFE